KTCDARRALIREQQSGQDSHRRGLAGTVRAEQSEDAACLDAQVDAAERLDVAIVLPQADGLDGGVGLHPFYASGRFSPRATRIRPMRPLSSAVPGGSIPERVSPVSTAQIQEPGHTGPPR